MQDDDAVEQTHVVIETPAPIDIGALRAAMLETLHGFPGAIVHFRAALPRNDMGKIQRQAVQAMVTRPSPVTPRA